MFTFCPPSEFPQALTRHLKPRKYRIVCETQQQLPYNPPDDTGTFDFLP